MTTAKAVRIRAACDALAEALIAALDEDAGSEAPARLMDITEACTTLGLGRSKIYGEIQAGRLRTVTVGSRRLVPATAISDFIAQASAEGGHGDARKPAA